MLEFEWITGDDVAWVLRETTLAEENTYVQAFCESCSSAYVCVVECMCTCMMASTYLSKMIVSMRTCMNRTTQFCVKKEYSSFPK